MNTILSQILLYITDFGRFIQRYFGDFSSFDIRYNWLVILFFLFVILLVGFSLGRTRLLAALLSTYGAAFIEPRFVYFSKLRGFFENVGEPWLHFGLFLVIYLITFAILNRSILKHRLTLKDSSFFSIFVLAIIEIGLLVSIFVNYLPDQAPRLLTPNIVRYFNTETARFVWAVLPVLVALFLRGGKRLSSKDL